MPEVISCLPVCYGRYGVEAAIERLPAAGIDYLELPIRTCGWESRLGDTPLVTDASTTAQIHQVERRIASAGLSISSCNILSGNPLDPDVLNIIKRKIDLAAQFGVSLVVGEAGEADSPESSATLLEHLIEIGDHAATRDVVYCFETHPGLCVEHRGMLGLMNVLDHPHLKLNFDTGNILYYNQNLNGEIALAKVCHHVRHLHLKDFGGEYGQWNFPALGYGGAVDFLRVRDTMRSCGFSGPYSIEIAGVAGEGELSLEEHHLRVRKSIAHLRTCGYSR
jgi:inosose dehydratase